VPYCADTRLEGAEVSGFAQKITAQVLTDSGHHLVYPPGVPLKLGDILIKNRGTWTPVGNLAERAEVEVDTADDEARDRWETQSTRGVQFHAKAEGEVNSAFKFLTDAEAGARVEFHQESTYTLGMKDVRFIRIRDVDRFWDDVKNAVPFWTWDLRRRIVTHIVVANSGTWLASATGNTSFELVAEGGLPAGGVASIADVAAGFHMKSHMSAKDSFVGLSKVTPLFKAHKVRFGGGFGPAMADLEQPKIGEEESRLVEDDGAPLVDDDE
jgi:hypothetical protein